jgi:exonuclease III
MKLLVWNCLGLRNTSAVRELLKCQMSKEADILCLSEIKMNENGGIVVLWTRGSTWC